MQTKTSVPVLPAAQVAANIAQALAESDQARAKLIVEIKSAQASCVHQIVSELPYRGGDYTSSPPVRICNHCLAIEEGSHWSGGKTWSKAGHRPSTLGNVEGRIVLTVDSNEFQSLRQMVPYMPPEDTENT